MARWTTLESSLKEHRGVGPGFHMLRHLLSLLILSHHCRVAVFGVHYDDSFAKGVALTATAAAKLSWGHLVVELLRPGLFALVGIFFALSGFLVAGSALRTNGIKRFFANRALRILPALSVEVVLSAVVLGPLVTALPIRQYFAGYQFRRYLGNIAGQVTFQLPGVFHSNPWPDMVNANLWTLPPELWCYLVMLLLIATGLLTRRAWLSGGIVCVAVVWFCLNSFDPHHYTIRDGATHFTSQYIVVMFCFGVLLLINASRVVLHPALFMLSAAIFYCLTLFDVLGPVSGFFLAYCTVYIGMVSFPLFDRLLKVDLSYGTYLYGFPITQALIFTLSPHLHGLSAVVRLLLILPLTIALTMVFSLMSWTYIEKPALSLRRHLIREPAPTAGNSSSTASALKRAQSSV